MLQRRVFLGSAAATVLAPTVFSSSVKPVLSLGLVADAQFADVAPMGTRFYRQSIEKLGKAVEHFNGLDLAFCVHLGDLIDRKWDSFDEIQKPLAQSKHRFQHLLGNHDFDLLDEYKARVPAKMGLGKPYSYLDQAGFRFVFLDSTDVSTYSQPTNASGPELARKTLAKFQKDGLPQAQPWNGAIGTGQITWLEETCADAALKKCKVILFSHHPVFPANVHNIWNSGEILKLIDKHPHIVAWLNGHNHAGNFGTRNGVPYVTLQGMVETVGTNSFAVAQLHEDRLVLNGQGREPSRELIFRKG